MFKAVLTLIEYMGNDSIWNKMFLVSVCIYQLKVYADNKANNLYFYFVFDFFLQTQDIYDIKL